MDGRGEEKEVADQKKGHVMDPLDQRGPLYVFTNCFLDRQYSGAAVAH